MNLIMPADDLTTPGIMASISLGLRCLLVRGKGFWASFLHSTIFLILQNYQNTVYLLNNQPLLTPPLKEVN